MGDNIFSKHLNIQKNELGELLKSRRESLGYSLESVSEVAGVSISTLINIEQGKSYDIDSVFCVLRCLRGEVRITWFDLKISDA